MAASVSVETGKVVDVSKVEKICEQMCKRMETFWLIVRLTTNRGKRRLLRQVTLVQRCIVIVAVHQGISLTNVTPSRRKSEHRCQALRRLCNATVVMVLGTWLKIALT